jgi:hypothetical protein
MVKPRGTVGKLAAKPLGAAVFPPTSPRMFSSIGAETGTVFENDLGARPQRFRAGRVLIIFLSRFKRYCRLIISLQRAIVCIQVSI